MSELDEDIVKVLEPNLQFLRSGPDDDARYYFPPEALQAVGWAATSIALPILLAGANEVVKTRVQDWLKRRRQEKLANELARSDDEAAGKVANGAEAVALIADYLGKRGWPAPMAQSDATEIVGLLQARLR